jgi:uncharacterized repeat protein (TIGR04076 family)
MAIEKEVMDFFQNHLEYTDEERALFANNPRNELVITKAAELMNKTIVAEVIESRGCNSQHKTGDKFYFDGAGNLITKLNPSRLCIFALQPLSAQIFGLHELFYAGIDNPKAAFNIAGCSDVGVQCGGWGHISMEVRMEDRKK